MSPWDLYTPNNVFGGGLGLFEVSGWAKIVSPPALAQFAFSGYIFKILLVSSRHDLQRENTQLTRNRSVKTCGKVTWI